MFHLHGLDGCNRLLLGYTISRTLQYGDYFPGKVCLDCNVLGARPFEGIPWKAGEMPLYRVDTRTSPDCSWVEGTGLKRISRVVDDGGCGAGRTDIGELFAFPPKGELLLVMGTLGSGNSNRLVIYTQMNLP
jgi:hypothetical protein